ncbi:MAG: hypothetical protein IKA61_05280 [Clostridia bacterium]|nr:hypothetical protein [Clostridia bacterium]
MTDIHCHVLPFVDDGSDSFETSVSMLEEQIRQGVKNVILTPHYRQGFYFADDGEIRKCFDELLAKVKERGLNINLFLGREITVYDNLEKDVKEGRFISLANSRFVLLEFPYSTDTDIEEICYKIKLLGYVPVVAHVERYSYYRSVEKVKRLKECGAVIQVNSAPIVKASMASENKFVKKLLKGKLVDVVASDWHSTRTNCFQDAYQKVKSKYKDYADLIFDINPTHIINSGK